MKWTLSSQALVVDGMGRTVLATHGRKWAASERSRWRSYSAGVPQGLLCAVVLCATSACGSGPNEEPPEVVPEFPHDGRPNIVVIFVDDMGYGDLTSQGSPDIQTPHLDSIAARGVRFTNGYTTAPQCSPARAGLLTGQYQQRYGHEANPEQEYRDTFGLMEGKPTLGDYLGATGYYTGAVGKWDLGVNAWSHPKHRGFDEWYGFLTGARYYDPNNGAGLSYRITTSPTDPITERHYLTDQLTIGAVDFIERNAERPFALYVAYSAPHEPFQAPAQYLERNQHILDEERRVYAAMVTALDDGVGRILTALTQHDLLENTLLVFVSDNGAPRDYAFTQNGNLPFRGHKGQLYEGGIRVPFFVQWPVSAIVPGQVYEGAVSTLDIIPTALGAAKQPIPEQLEGRDFLPYVFGEREGSAHEALFWRWMGHKALRSDAWKWVTDGGAGPGELYDLSADPSEQVNLAAEQPERLAELTEVWRTWNRELAAPEWRTAEQLAVFRDRYYGEGMTPAQ